jgi:thiopurine S-methyltransferase
MSDWNQGLTLWHDRWAEGRIGFHRDAPNRLLEAHSQRLLEGAQRVLVPLCGKSVDMPWLASKGVEVVGVELVPAAIEAFWEDQGLTPEVDHFHGFTRTSSGRMTLLQGDIFHLMLAHTGTVDAIYDRAALIAIPPARQPEYAHHMLSLLKPGGSMLLLTYDMPVPPEKGPPFSVHPDRVPALFGDAAQVELLETIMHTPETEPKLLQRGVDWARESVFHIVR